MSNSAFDNDLGTNDDLSHQPISTPSDTRRLSQNTGRVSVRSRPPSNPRASIRHSGSASSISVSSTTSSASPSSSSSQSSAQRRHRQRKRSYSYTASASTPPSLSASSSATMTAAATTPSVPVLKHAVPKTRDMFNLMVTPSCYGPVEALTLFLVLCQVWSLVLIPYVPRIFYVFPFVFWRTGYNVGIAILLYYQRHYRSITKFTQNLSPDARSLLAWAVSRPVSTRPYSWEETSISFNSWLAFRSVATVILMNDGLSFGILAIACFTPFSQSSMLTVLWTLPLAMPLLALGVWTKSKAHLAITDYAWFWGDFFFLKPSPETVGQSLNDDDPDAMSPQEKSNFFSSGIFAIFPHPMYTVGYAPMYAASLLCRSYLLLLVSLLAHSAQIAFLVFVEQPHIDAIYGNNDSNSSSNTNSNQLGSSLSSLSSSTSSPNTSPLLSSLSTSQQQKQRSDDKNRNAADNPALRLFEQSAPHPIVFLSMCLLCAILLMLCITRPPPALVVVPLCIAMRVLHWLGIAVFLERPTNGDNRWITLLRSTGTAHSRIYSAWQHSLLLSNMLNHTLFTCAALSTAGRYPTFFEFSTRGLALSCLALIMFLFSWFVSQAAYRLTGDFTYYYGDFFVSIGTSTSTPLPTPASGTIPSSLSASSPQPLLYSATSTKTETAQNGLPNFDSYLCRQGPYQFLRHPHAVCSYMAYFAIAITLQSPVAALLACFAHVLHLLFVSGIEVPHIAREYYCVDVSNLPTDAYASKLMRSPSLVAIFTAVPAVVPIWTALQSWSCRSSSALVLRTVQLARVTSVRLHRMSADFKKVVSHVQFDIANTAKIAVENAQRSAEVTMKFKCKRVILQLRRYGLKVHDVGPSAGE